MPTQKMKPSEEMNNKIRNGTYVCWCVPFDPLLGLHNYACMWAWAVSEVYRLGRLEDGDT